MEVKPALALPDGLELTAIEMVDDVFIVTLISTQFSPCCPLCRAPAARLHSHYTRQAADFPWSRQRVRMLLQVRKYFCEMTACVRKIFVELLKTNFNLDD